MDAKTQKVPEGFYIDYSELSPFQKKIIEANNDKSMVVKGDAGTGKSLIALHKAKQVAALGKTYMIVVYTKTLKQYFADGLEALDLKYVYYYKEWKKKKRSLRHVDFLIVDECQDFSSEEIDELRSQGDICFFFGDSAQSIMNFTNTLHPHYTQSVEETAQKLDAKDFELYYNFRLTKQTAAVAEIVGQQTDLVDKCVREGQKPYLVEASDFDAQLDRIAEVIKNGDLQNVGILLPYNTNETAGRSAWKTGKPNLSVEYVKDYLFNKGVLCEFKYDDEQTTQMDLDFHTDLPKILTW